jgi:nucleoside-diphosphate-sugar epimerase
MLVTGAAGDIGAIGRHLTAMLLARGHEVRALVRREDEPAQGLRRLGAELTGEAPTGMYDFVRSHAAEFTRGEAAA